MSAIFNFLFYVSAVDCGPPPVPLNGSSYGTLTVFPNAIRFSCDPGFLLGGSVKRQCLPTGVWSGNNTICEGKILVQQFLLFPLPHDSTSIVVTTTNTKKSNSSSNNNGENDDDDDNKQIQQSIIRKLAMPYQIVISISTKTDQSLIGL